MRTVPVDRLGREVVAIGTGYQPGHILAEHRTATPRSCTATPDRCASTRSAAPGRSRRSALS
ncbi:hypothetical protein [Amycolatopsis sp. MEPSY49]|uniref:hypothetical protein n=1 Tax=Amycolatopsis sp. MEPSY49 TaxID=3151600 RepID=UPI003EF9046F